MTSVVETQVRPVHQRLMCDCGGEMVYTGTMKMSNSPWYEHECTADGCGAHTSSRLRYPRIAWITEDSAEIFVYEG